MTSPPILRKLIVEVIEARDLVPKDGFGTSSPYVVIDFAGQRKRTHTRPRDLNPQWQQRLEFIVPDPASMPLEELNVEVYNDKRFGPAGAGRKNNFLGRVRIYGSQFARRGEEGLIYFPLEKRNLLSWIRGEIGLKIYYYDESPEDVKKPPEKDSTPPPPPPPLPEIPAPTEAAIESQPPAVVNVEEIPPAIDKAPIPVPEDNTPPLPEIKNVNKMISPSPDRVRRRVISGNFETDTTIPSVYDLVEPMQYLFIRIIRARGLRQCQNPFVKIRTDGREMKSRSGDGVAGNPEWNQVFSLSQSKPESWLEISVWEDSGTTGEAFLGGVCFDLSDVPVKEQPDGPLAPQWYHLDGGKDYNVTGDIMVSVWLGTQADETFPESYNSDAPNNIISYTRSKVYQSPKLWYLRTSIIEAQDLRVQSPATMIGTSHVDLRVKIQIGFQSARTRRSNYSSNASTFAWVEDLMFVVSEPFDDQLIVLVEDRSGKDPVLLGHVTVPVATVEQRIDERQIIPTKWFNIEDNTTTTNTTTSYIGRIQLRICLEGGYHVLDEAAHLCSDFRPTAKQLWKPAVGELQLGIISAKALQPMKTKSGGKGSTDAYCVAKYGKKWIRTRTITDSFDPKWNEQYTWKVYDPCTVLTVGVFDNWRMFSETAATGKDHPDYRIGKIRIRISTLESNCVYTQSYPLLLLLRSGLKTMGEIQIAIRFSTTFLLPDTCAFYSTPLLPRMHYLRPIGVSQQEALRNAAIRTVAIWLGRAEPPLGPEVIRYMLDADSHSWSLRRSKANWFRIMGVIAWAVGLGKWLNDVRQWRNPVTTVLVHLLYLVLVWYPELAAPTGCLYVFMIGAWYYRFRPKGGKGMDARLSQAEGAEEEELDEEFDGMPSGKTGEVVRRRYDRLRVLGGRVQTVMGDLAAQGERVQALVSWRDPRATRVFIVMCLVGALVLYVVPPKMVAVAMGFYFLRHPMFRDPMPPAGINFFRRLPSLSDRLL